MGLSPPCSARRLDVDSLGEGRFPQAGVVGKDRPQVRTDRQSGGEVDGVQRTQLGRPEIAGPIKDRLVEADQADCLEQATGLADEVIIARASQGAHRLGARQRG